MLQLLIYIVVTGRRITTKYLWLSKAVTTRSHLRSFYN
jgi:hypothetical protein